MKLHIFGNLQSLRPKLAFGYLLVLWSGFPVCYIPRLVIDMKANEFMINVVQKNLPSHRSVPSDLINLALTICAKIMKLFD